MTHSIEWQKLTIPLAEVDAPRLLSAWRWLLDRPVEAIELTRFLDWFVVDSAGAVHRLDILEGSFAQVCRDVAEFQARRERDDERLDWYLEEVVRAAYRRGLVPGRGHGFGFRLPPVLGGPVGPEHVTVVEAASWQFFMAELHEKVRALPPGARVRGLTVDGSRPGSGDEPPVNAVRTASVRKPQRALDPLRRPWWRFW